MAKILGAQVNISSYINGCAMSSGGGASYNVNSGDCLDSTRTYTIALATNFTKTNGAWVAGTGNGSLDTGSAAINTTYFVFVIYNPTTDTADVLMSLSSTSPTMPSGYTLKRRVGILTTSTSSTNFTAFFQVDKTFYWNPGFNFTSASIATSSTNFTLQQCPVGITVVPLFIPTMNAYTNNSTNGMNFAQPGQSLAVPAQYSVSPTSQGATQAYCNAGGSVGEGSADNQAPFTMVSTVPTSTGQIQARTINLASTANIYFIGFVDSTLYN